MSKITQFLGWLAAIAIAAWHFITRGKVSVSPGKVELPKEPQDDSGTLSREEIERMLGRLKK